jgi:hypothetical protein
VFAFPKRRVDEAAVAAQVQAALQDAAEADKHVLLLWEPAFAHALPAVLARLTPGADTDGSDTDGADTDGASDGECEWTEEDEAAAPEHSDMHTLRFTAPRGCSRLLLPVCQRTALPSAPAGGPCDGADKARRAEGCCGGGGAAASCSAPSSASACTPACASASAASGCASSSSSSSSSARLCGLSIAESHLRRRGLLLEAQAEATEGQGAPGAADVWSRVELSRLIVLHLGQREASARMLAARCVGADLRLFTPPPPPPQEEEGGGGAAAADGSGSSGSSGAPSLSLARLMAQRYRCVEAVRNSSVVGIVAGTLGVARHTEVVAALRAACARQGKGCYVLLVGKISPTKLGNFPECDVFVYVSCPEAALVDGSSYNRPIATPHEAFVALAPTEDFPEADAADTAAGFAWSGRSELEFGPLVDRAARSGLLQPLEGQRQEALELRARRRTQRLARMQAARARRGADETGVEQELDLDAASDDEDEAPTLSLVSGSRGLVGGGGGTGRAAAVDAAAVSASSAAAPPTAVEGGASLVASSHGETTLSTAVFTSSAGDYLLTKREWRGLAYEVPEEAASTVIVKGLAGVASGYRNEL